MLSDGHDEVVDDVERANLLNRTFAAKFTDPSVDVDELPDGPVYDLPPLTALHCDADTVRTILRDVTANKACGPDGISARVVHECAEELAVPLAVMFNSSLSQGTFPKLWKRANVVPIHKKGSVKDPQNYRSISLMSLFVKVFEKLVSELAHVLPARLYSVAILCDKSGNTAKNSVGNLFPPVLKPTVYIRILLPRSKVRTMLYSITQTAVLLSHLRHGPPHTLPHT